MGSVLTVIRVSLTLDLFLNFLRRVFLPASDWDFQLGLVSENGI